MRRGRRGFVSNALALFSLLLFPIFFLIYSSEVRPNGNVETRKMELSETIMDYDTRLLENVNQATIKANSSQKLQDAFPFPPVKSRHRIYAGSWYNLSLSEREISNAQRELCVMKRNEDMPQKVKTDTLHLLTRSDLESCDKNSKVPALKGGKYCDDAVSFFDTGIEVEHILVTFGDVTPNSSLPFITKSRPQSLSHRGILWPLNVNRHFSQLGPAYLSDTPWEDKRPRLVWRGADTGRGARAKLVKRFYSDLDKEIDIALTTVLEYGDSAITRPAMSMKELLRNRYLLSLEGNDVSSGLKWMLLSKSVVFMPDPTYESWALETQLKPFLHYIPVEQDLSDLHEKLEWAKQNEQACREISDRATKFMSNFLGYAERNNSQTDLEIKQLLVQSYKNAMRQILGDHPIEICELNNLSSRSAN